MEKNNNNNNINFVVWFDGPCRLVIQMNSSYRAVLLNKNNNNNHLTYTALFKTLNDITQGGGSVLSKSKDTTTKIVGMWN